MNIPLKEILRKRLTERKDADSAERRLEADDLDFMDFKDYYIRIKNEDF